MHLTDEMAYCLVNITSNFYWSVQMLKMNKTCNLVLTKSQSITVYPLKSALPRGHTPTNQVGDIVPLYKVKMLIKLENPVPASTLISTSIIKVSHIE